MEIINYVQNEDRKTRFSFPKLPRFSSSKDYKKTSSITYSPYTTELRSFSATKVKLNFTLPNLFKVIGSALSDSHDFVKANAKKISISSIIIAALCLISVFSVKLINYKINFTNPLKLNFSDTLELDTLNKLMEEFAMEGALEIDESGNLLDSESAAQIFTQAVTYQNYTVKSGDTISGITKKFGLTNISTLISVNDIGNVRQLAAGQKLKIPSIDGILYTVKSGDSLAAIVKAYNTNLENVLDVNDLESETLKAGQQLFLPGIALDSNTLKNALGELFMLPIQAKFRWSSPFGYRIDPIANVKSFHTGTDMACPTGTPILAAMSGKVVTAGQNRIYGNYVIIDHQNGYQTVYAHMSKIIATKGQWVSQGTRIGLVGSTGYSTGPHLHFTVYKNGNLIDPQTVLSK